MKLKSKEALFTENSLILSLTQRRQF